MVRPQSKPIEFQIAPRPVLIRLRHINGSGTRRATSTRIHRETSGVRKQIENAFACRVVANDGTRLAMVKEQPGIQVISEIHFKFEPLLLHRAHHARVTDSVILLSAILNSTAALHVQL